ncbi:protein CBFA2T1-like isoform X2 [Anneissia japonica]|uniref:protein CBFA2T1-like isoform X2 n=1 Tax=Anneissia japonica TaxID=1529436 RepID=UPI0014256E31|nr:protein CBFA2T1-like isoform X2 [Anneissia japonica]
MMLIYGFNFQLSNILRLVLKTLTDPLEGKMPDSPIDAALVKHPSQCSPNMVQANMVASHPRPVSTGSSTGAPALNGVPSPHHSTPSPPGQVNGQELPPACGARQLSKLKRFLTTLQQFGNDISPEIGERVRGLVMGLVNNHLTVEEFHNKLQEATNFPLRPFVIPFLKTNLPLLQRELMHCARMAKLTPQQYYMQHENQLLDTKTSPIETDQILMDVNENGKRRTPEGRISNGPKDLRSDRITDHPAAKRRCSGSPASGHQNGPPGNHFPHMPPHQIRMEDLAHAREMRDMRERFEREHNERHRHSSFSSRDLNYPDHPYFEGRGEDDWKHVETMLECIVGMVDKTKRAINMLRQRSIQDREELALWARRHAEGTENDIKKRVGDMMAHTFRQTDDRVSEVKRRAGTSRITLQMEEAVNEVKRQAVTELQKAVQAAELKANELVTAERAKLDHAVLDAKRAATEEALSMINSQDSSSESCWNCGRKANETCSGCNTARYCGSFCQHKDWENHHKMCGKLASQNNSTESSSNTKTATTPSPVATSPPNKNSTTSDLSTASKSRSSSPSSAPSEANH